MTPLCEISRKYGTDKGGVMEPYPNHRANMFHDYTPVYWQMLESWRSEVRSVLEIGVADDRSTRMWAEFFGNARIVGFDIREECLIKENRIRTFYCDQSKPKSLYKAYEAAGGGLYDVIIDDGSHIYDHQRKEMPV